MTNTAKATVVAAVATACLLGMSVRAEDGKEAKGGDAAKAKHPMAEEIFQKMDANSDGTVSKEEFLAFHEARAKDAGREGAPKDMLEKRFTALDTDKDGKLTKEEFQAGGPRRPHGKHGAEGGAAVPPPPPPPAKQ